MTLSLGKLRPAVGQCCPKCTPGSLSREFRQKSIPSFHNLLSIDNTHARYQGWLVRRISVLLFVSGCKVSLRPAGNRLERICQSNRVKEAVAAEPKASEGRGGREKVNRLSPYLALINTSIMPSLVRFVGWLMLKVFASVFDNVQVDLNHLAPLQRASQKGSLLLYVHVRQSHVDCALVPLVLFCHKLTVPYTVCPLQCSSFSLRAILQRVGVLLLPPSLQTEEDAERDSLFFAVMTSLVDELLHEGQAISVGLSAGTGHGGQWLAHIMQLLKQDSVTDVTLVPVGISYDCVPDTHPQIGLGAIFHCLRSLVWRKRGGSVRVHFAQPFSLKEMYERGRCSADEWLPLQDLLLPIILGDRAMSMFGRRKMSWLLPSELTHSERDVSVAVLLHLTFSVSSCAALMSTSLMSALLLHRHRKGATVSLLCQDLAWLTAEVLFRNKDVGFQGSLAEIAHYSLSLLAPHLIIAASPSRKEPFILARVSPVTSVHLSRHAELVTHTFILEAVGACAVSAMLCEVVGSGASPRVAEEGKVKGDLEFDVVLCQSELTDRALQLCLLLPPGLQPPCQSSQNFARDAVDSLVRCGILVIEEAPRNNPTCDFWKREGFLPWTTDDDSGHSDSDCEEQEACSYKISQPSHCPEMLFFLCSMLAGHLRALCWTTAALDLLDAPLPKAEFVARIHSHLCDTANKKKRHYESCTEESARTAVRTLIDLGVVSEQLQAGGAVSLHVAPRFQLPENRQRLTHFISQYVYN